MKMRDRTAARPLMNADKRQILPAAASVCSDNGAWPACIGSRRGCKQRLSTTLMDFGGGGIAPAKCVE